MEFIRMLAVIHEVILDGFGLVCDPGLAFVFAACNQGVACHFMHCMIRMSEQKELRFKCRGFHFSLNSKERAFFCLNSLKLRSDSSFQLSLVFDLDLVRNLVGE